MSVSRPAGRLFFFWLMLAAAILAGAARAQTVTSKTLIQDVLYHADGTPAKGSLLISWPAFTTGNGQAIAAGSMTANLGPDGSVSLSLFPNTGSTPQGACYTVVLDLDDGRSTEFWVIPQVPQTTIAAIRSKLVPRAEAMQYVGRDYVDSSIATALTGSVVLLTGDQQIAGVKAFQSAPTVPTPQQASEAANKDYVDAALSAKLSASAKNQAGGYVGVNSDGSVGVSDATKEPVPASAAAGNFAVFDANKYVVDSGKKPADFAAATASTSVNGVACALGSSCTVYDSTKVPVAVVPATAPAAGQLLVGNAAGTAYAPQALSGDCALGSSGAIACTKTNGNPFGPAATKAAQGNSCATGQAAQGVDLNFNATGCFTPAGSGNVSGLGSSANGNLAAYSGASGTVIQDSELSAESLNGFRNRLINSGGQGIDQRNAGVSQTITAGAALAYTIDRWYAYSTGANVTGQRITGSTGIRYRYQFTGAAGVTGIGFAQRTEAANSFDLAGQAATFCVELADSLLSSVSWTASYANSADAFGSLASPTKTQIASGTWTVSSTLAKYCTAISMPAAATTGIELSLSVGAQSSGTWTIGAAQFELGSQGTPFERRPYGQELELAQRYYEALNLTTNATPTQLAFFSTIVPDRRSTSAFFKVRKRSVPTVVLFGYAGVAGQVEITASGGGGADTNYNFTASTPDSFYVDVSGGSGSGTFGYYARSYADAEL
jgi:hypothetical protein